MKKSIIAAAIAAAAISAGAHAARPLHVDFGNPGVEMFIGNVALVVTCPVDAKVFSIDGFNTSLVQMQGNLCLDPYNIGDPFIILTFNRVTGAYSSAGPNPGTTFTSGSIAIDVQTTGGYIGYDVIDVSVNNLQCLSTTAGGLGGVATAGLQFPGGSNPLPGIWDGVASSAHEGDALCVTSLLGQNAALFGKGKTVN
jgi:hypothetical protein